jgi:hypothetical protein
MNSLKCCLTGMQFFLNLLYFLGYTTHQSIRCTKIIKKNCRKKLAVSSNYKIHTNFRQNFAVEKSLSHSKKCSNLTLLPNASHYLTGKSFSLYGICIRKLSFRQSRQPELHLRWSQQCLTQLQQQHFSESVLLICNN